MLLSMPQLMNNRKISSPLGQILLMATLLILMSLEVMVAIVMLQGG
jgi:hypothetical protein